MNSGGMKFSLRDGLLALGALSCFAGVLCIGQLSAEENDKPVRFKLSDDGESGKIIVIEKSPENRDTQRQFENGLRFKRDENGNIYRTGDFKEIEPRPAVRSEKPASETVKSPVESQLVKKPNSTEPKEETKPLLPELPSLDTLFPKLEWSGFDEVFDGFAAESNSTAKRHSGAPGLKIKTRSQPRRSSVEPRTAEAPVQPEVADAKPEVVQPMPEVVDPMPEDVVNEQPPMKVVREAPTEVANERPTTANQVDPEIEQTIENEEVNEASESQTDVEVAVEQERKVDSVTGLPLLVDLELSDLHLPQFKIPELEIPELDLPDLSLFFGTSSKPFVNENGEIPDAIQQQAEVEEPMEESVGDMIPMESPVEDVLESDDSEKANTDAAVETEVKKSPASNTSLFDLPSIDLGLAEFFGFSTETEDLTESDGGSGLAEKPNNEVAAQSGDSTLDVETHSAPSVRHRVPGRKSIGSAGHRDSKVSPSSGKSYDLFSEFKIPEFNNPFDFGVGEARDIESEQKAITIPELKRPTVPDPDSSILDSLPELNSERPSVPGLKLMRTKAPKSVPMAEESDSLSSDLEESDGPELGSGIPAAPVDSEEQSKLVDPDKILDEYKKEEK